MLTWDIDALWRYDNPVTTPKHVLVAFMDARDDMSAVG